MVVGAWEDELREREREEGVVSIMDFFQVSVLCLKTTCL